MKKLVTARARMAGEFNDTRRLSFSDQLERGHTSFSRETRGRFYSPVLPDLLSKNFGFCNQKSCHIHDCPSTCTSTAGLLFHRFLPGEAVLPSKPLLRDAPFKALFSSDPVKTRLSRIFPSVLGAVSCTVDDYSLSNGCLQP